MKEHFLNEIKSNYSYRINTVVETKRIQLFNIQLAFWPYIYIFFPFQDDEPPEITYCVVENTGTLTLQAITPTQPMPSQEELDVKFAELVVSSDKYLNYSLINIVNIIQYVNSLTISHNKETLSIHE